MISYILPKKAQFSTYTYIHFDVFVLWTAAYIKIINACVLASAMIVLFI